MAPRPNSDVAVLGPLGRLPACTCGGATAAGPTAVPAVDPAADPANVPDDGDDDIRVVVTAAASTAAARTRDAGGTRFKRFVRRIRDGLCELRHSKLAAPAVPSRGRPECHQYIGPAPRSPRSKAYSSPSFSFLSTFVANPGKLLVW